MQTITARQSGSQIESEEDITTTLAKVMLIGEQTGISLRTFIEETDRDPELNLLKQAILDNNRKQIPAAY